MLYRVDIRPLSWGLRKAIGRTIAALLVTITLSICAAAQSESGGAAIEGAVADQSGKALAGAHVRIRNVETGYTRALATDANGRYIAQALPVGTYLVEATADGFAAARFENVQLTVGNSKTLNFEMKPPTVNEGVVVSVDPATVERKEMATSTTIGWRSITDLPIRGRNFPEFVKLTPSVLQESDRFGLVIAGQRSINSNVSIDGADFNDPLQGNQRGGNDAVFFFPQTAVREFQVIRSGATVEVGRTSAGFVNVVTKSGSNDFHGEAFYFNRNTWLTWEDAFEKALTNKQNQFGGSIGGPIVQDRAFFFIGAEQNFLQVPFFTKFKAQPAGVVVPAELAALEGEHKGTNNPASIFARTDITLNNRDSLNIYYTFARVKAENFNPEAAPEDAETDNFTREGQSHGIKAGFVSVFSPTLLNEARAQVATDNRDEVPNSASAQIIIAGFGRLGGDPSRPRHFDSTRYEVTDNLSASRGAHQVRVGFDLNISRVQQERITNIQGRYDFLSLADYNVGKIDRYRQALPVTAGDGPLFHGTQKELAFYAQDKLALRRDLTLTAGVRWEGQWNPQPVHPNPKYPQTALIPNDLGQWQPRLGLAWSVRGNGKTIVRLSAGLYDARTPATLFQRVTTDNGIATALLDTKVDKNLFSFLKFPNALTAVPAGIKLAVPSLIGFDSGFQNPRSFQTSGTIEQLIGRTLLVSAGYLHNSTWNLQRRLDRNLKPPTIDATGMPIFPKERPDPTIGPFSINESSAHSRYDGLVLSLNHRFAQRFHLLVNYTLSRTFDDDSNERNFRREAALNPFNLSLERAYSKQDVRHNFSVSGLTNLPAGFTYSAILLTRTAFPYTPVIGTDTQNDGNSDNDRAIINGHVVGRNSFREPSFFNLDMRLFKAFRLGERFHLDVIAEGFNVTRASNANFGPDSVSIFGTPAKPDPDAGQPLFAPSTARFGGPRQVQLGMRFVF